jgi:hypothetical protein
VKTTWNASVVPLTSESASRTRRAGTPMRRAH